MEDILDSFKHIIVTRTEVGLFLSLAIGYLLGRLRIKDVAIGSVAGILLASLVIGAWAQPQYGSLLKTVFFDLFLFALGYSVGPQFFDGLNRDSLKLILLTLIVAIVSIISVIVCSKLMKFDLGTAAGIASGALTTSAVIGSSTGAIGDLNMDEISRQTLADNVPIAYAITYPFGVVGLLILLVNIIPSMAKTSLREEAEKLENELSVDKENSEPGVISASQPLTFRAFKIINPEIAGRKVSDIGKLYPGICIEKIRRDNQIMKGLPETILQLNDSISMVAPRNTVLNSESIFGPELDDEALLDFQVAMVDIVITNKNVENKSLGSLAHEHGRGIGIISLKRQNESLPLRYATKVNRGDVLKLIGTQEALERAGNALGYAERPTEKSDTTYLSFGVVLGTLIGIPSLYFAHMQIGIGTSVGCLLIGLIFGWLRSRTRRIGVIPNAALGLLIDLGLAVFIAIVGLQAGPAAVHAWTLKGPLFFCMVFIAGIIVTLGGPILGYYIGSKIFKINLVILLGALAGSHAESAVLAALKDEADSNTPTLGYTIPYALTNVLLTFSGPLIVTIMHTLDSI